MVKPTEIHHANAAFAREQHVDLVCVFAGATSGIGASTMEKLATMVRSATFYIVGRSAARFAPHRARLESLNPNVQLVFFEADVSLLADIDRFAKLILDAESKVDLLYTSPGLLPLTGAHYTKEGLELCFVLSYYTRMRLLANLLPLLAAAPKPRVLSVLNAGKEKAIREDDINLDRSWSPLAAIGHTTTMTTLAFEHLAAQNKNIVFLHAFPGLVRTDIGTHLVAPPGAGIVRRVFVAVIRRVIGALMFFLAITPEESGERHAYQLTSPTFGPGAWRVDENCELVTAPGVLARYRTTGWPNRIWEFTQGVFERALEMGSGGGE